MNFLSEEEIKTLETDELLSYLEAIRNRTPVFEIEHNEIDDVLFAQEEIKLDDLDPYYSGYRPEGTLFVFPKGDSRESELHDYRFLGKKVVPRRNFFWVVKPRITYKNHAIVEVDVVIEKHTVNQNNRMYPSVRAVASSSKIFIYDFDENIYKEVDMKSKEKKHRDRKDELLLRKELNLMLEYRLEVLHSEYVKYLSSAAYYMNSVKKSTFSRIREFKDFFIESIEKLEHIKSTFLIKYVSDHVDRENYDVLKTYIEESLEKCEESFEEIKYIDDDLNVRETEYSELNQELHDVVFHVKRLFEERKLKSKSNEGFIKITEDRVFYNLSHIEIIRIYSDQHGSDYSWKEDEELLINEFKRSKEKIVSAAHTDYFIDETNSLSDDEIMSFLDTEKPLLELSGYALRTLDKPTKKAFLAFMNSEWTNDEAFVKYVNKKLEKKKEILKEKDQ
ncbi:hypothetical protein [Halobacillus faecis]|uniref:Uncharacterized protein n=1 Tax=Halobacillus faecis TaxID=360184 RepID=A0A511WWL1_9BACI|nr:hypothetical protein [Halobacillus faecis]GEN55510.1 hypothetical protein HFA01_37720 [Halobacillus faecis]